MAGMGQTNEPRDWREGRRLRAGDLHQQGWSQIRIAQALGVTPGAVSQWIKRGNHGGAPALRTGRRLAPHAAYHLRSAPTCHPCWPKVPKRMASWVTSGRKPALPRSSNRNLVLHTTVIILVAYCGRAAGPSKNRSNRRASATRRPSCGGKRNAGQRSKKAEDEERTLIWVDESGFYLLPAVVRTYAPCGETPTLRAKLSYDHLAVISGLTPAGQLLMQVQERAFTSPDIVRFLKHLLQHMAGKLLIIWDGAPIHRGQPIKDFLAAGGAARIQLEQLPGYAPELNPAAGIWHYLKRVELKNLVCHTLDELRYELRLATARLRHKSHILKSCIRHAGMAL